MKLVSQILEAKGSQVWTISPETAVYDALKLMAEKNIGALVVLEDDKVVGILSERDYARKVVLEGKSSKNTPVGEIMSVNVLYVLPEQTIEECMALISRRHFRHLPVMDNDKLVGLVSIGDIVKAVIADKEFIIAQLENYITGTY